MRNETSILIPDCVCLLRHWYPNLNGELVSASIFRIEIDRKKIICRPSAFEPILIWRQRWCAGPQLPSSLMRFDYQYMNKLAIYHARASATENWKWKMMMMAKVSSWVWVCLLLASRERVKISIGTFSLSLFHIVIAVRICATIFHLIAPIWMINDLNIYLYRWCIHRLAIASVVIETGARNVSVAMALLPLSVPSN